MYLRSPPLSGAGGSVGRSFSLSDLKMHLVYYNYYETPFFCSKIPGVVIFVFSADRVLSWYLLYGFRGCTLDYLSTLFGSAYLF